MKHVRRTKFMIKELCILFFYSAHPAFKNMKPVPHHVNILRSLDFVHKNIHL